MQQKEIQFIIIVASVTLVILSVTLVLFLFFIMRKKTQFILEKQKTKNKFKEEIMIAKEEIHEQILKNISWILHDNIGQLLSVLNIQLHQIKQDLPEKGHDLLLSALDVNKKTIHEIRALSHSLNEDYLKKIDFEESIQNELRRLEELGYITAHFEMNDSNFQLNEKVRLILFRIFQEFLNNTIKHSEAKQIFVKIHVENNNLRFSIKDDGKGFDTADHSNFGMGLTNIINRIKLINASYELKSAKDEGSELIINYSNPKL